jgi:hypothetical protein
VSPPESDDSRKQIGGERLHRARLRCRARTVPLLGPRGRARQSARTGQVMTIAATGGTFGLFTAWFAEARFKVTVRVLSLPQEEP